MPDDTRRDTIEIRTMQRQVWVNGKAAAIGPRAFDLLMALYERRERVVTKNELLDIVWPGLVVEENNLQVQVSTLRKVLGPAAIATIPGRGYRFTLPDEAFRAVHGVVAEPGSEDDGSAAALRGNLPAAPPMLGRDEDLAAVVALLARHPVVSIIGAGGIGKTRLALAVAQASTLDTPGGRWWVELAPLADATQVAGTVAAAIGLQLASTRRPAEALGAALAKHKALIVLDNCEHVADAAAEVIACIRAQAPDVRLLVTSQELLKCIDEQTFRLASLALPDTDDLDSASRCGAVALFIARAHAADPRFALAADNVRPVIDICRRLDGIPLAIELAAARVPMLGVQGLHARLDQMFNVLTGAARMRLRRHQTLRAALEWSYGLLNDEERAVFRRLGVFAGGFTLALAQSTTSDAQIDRWQVLDLLSQLIDKSLVVAEGDGEPRYRLLEPTRAYALEQLAAAGESAAYLRRHAEAMVEAMDAWNRDRWKEPMPQRLRALVELGNVRAAADWTMGQDGDRRMAIRLLSVAWFQWVANNLRTEFLERMAALWPLPPGLAPEEEAAFCLAFASVRDAGERDDVLQAARRAVALYRALGETELLADALIRIGVVGCGRSDVEETDAAIAEAAALIGSTAAPRKRASLAMVQGMRALDQRRFADAADAYRRQSACYREEGAEFGENLALFNLAMVSLDMGEVDDAIETLERAIAGLQRTRAPYGLGAARALMTLARAIRGDDEDGLTCSREAFQAMLNYGHMFCDKPLMAAAMYHARRGELQRAALIVACVEGPNVRGKKQVCPMDERLDADVGGLLIALPADERVRCREVGARLTLTQVAAVAYDGAPIDALSGSASR